MFTKLIDKLFGSAIEPLHFREPKPAPPRYSLDDPRHPINVCDGWHRSDLPTGRRARRVEIGDV